MAALIPQEIGAGYGTLIFEQNVSAPGVASAASSRTDPGHSRLYAVASVSHNDPVDRHMIFYIQDTRSGAPFVVLRSTREGGQAAVAANLHFALHRPIVVPEFWRLVAEPEAIAAGQVTTLRMGFYDVALLNPSRLVTF